jgi:hypothetical protein
MATPNNSMAARNKRAQSGDPTYRPSATAHGTTVIQDRADYYRHRANELRRRAEEVSCRLFGEWLKLAERYEALAENLERRGENPIPPRGQRPGVVIGGRCRAFRRS